VKEVKFVKEVKDDYHLRFLRHLHYLRHLRFHFMTDNLIHPGRHLLQEIKAKGRNQKQFSAILGKKISELNELINGKRNITIQRDILLGAAF